MDYEKKGIEFGHRWNGEVREVEETDDEYILEARAAVFDKWADIGGMFEERIRPGAFGSAIKTSDVRFLVNHQGLPLARTSSGTMTLRESGQGLEMRARLAKSDPDVMALIPKIRRGDLNQLSFAFKVGEDGQSWNDDYTKRSITNIAELFDTSIVTYPAYKDAKVTALRSLDLLDHAKAESDIRESQWRGTIFGR